MADLPNERALHNRVANVRLLQEAMADEVLRRTRYSAKSTGDGVTVVKSTRRSRGWRRLTARTASMATPRRCPRTR